MRVKIKAGVLKAFIRQAIDEGWTGEEAMPTSVEPPPEVMEPVPINPATETQVADSDLPVDDDEWQPGNPAQMGLAMKQIAEQIPDGQIGYVWPRLKLLIQKAQENVEGQALAPEVAPMETQERMNDAGY